MKKLISLTMILVISLFCLFGCSLAEVSAGTNETSSTHQWENTTCTEPTICLHKWKNATCTEPATCTLCGETAGTAIGHQWAAATYETPKTCIMCGKTAGDVEARRCLICDKKIERKNWIYCDTHGCWAGDCQYPAKHVGNAWGKYCLYHSCQELTCLGKPIGSITGYCPSHQTGG